MAIEWLERVCKGMVALLDDPTTRTDRRAMGETGAAAAAATVSDGPARARPSHHRQRHPLATGDRGAVARSAGTVWAVADGVQPLAPVAAGRRLGPGAGGAASRGRRRRRPRLAPPLSRRHDDPGAPKRGRGEKRGGDQALGRSRGGFSTKIHLRAERSGKPICVVLTPGQRHEATQVAALLERGAVKRIGGGRPRIRPARVVGDKGYTGRPIRTYLRRRGIGAVIPRLRTESRRGVRFDRAAYRERNVVERTINRLKQHRAIATRYEKLEETFHALLTLACILLWL